MTTSRQPGLSYLQWAKSKGPGDLLSHSSIDLPQLGEVVNRAYCTREFAALLREDNQWGHGRLKAAVASRYGIDDTDEQPQVLLTPGASSGLFLVCKAFLAYGDEIIVESPAYEPFVAAAQSAGAKVIWWERIGPGFSLDLHGLVRSRLITDKTKLILISNPHNPSSNLALDSELQQLAHLVRSASNGVKIVVDEIYRDLIRGKGDNAHGHETTTLGKSARSVVELGDEFISISSLSKVYGLSRLRTGWILGAADVIKRIRRTYETVINIGSLDTEAVSAIIFGHLDNYLQEAQAVVSANREMLRDSLMPWMDDGVLSGDVPEHGCVYFPRLAARLHDSQDSGERNAIDTLAQECGVVPGVYFGSAFRGHFRLGFGGNTDRFRTSVHKLTATLERLAKGAPT